MNPEGLTLDAAGTILVIDLDAGTGSAGALFTVVPATGARTILSDFGDATQGPTGVSPLSLTLNAAGTILVVDPSAGTGSAGVLFTVDPATGARMILSDFGHAAQGPTGTSPVDLVLNAAGTILVVDQDVGTAGAGALFTVNPATGNRAILSDFGDPIKGPTGVNPDGVAIFAAVAPPDTIPPETAISGAVDGRAKAIVNGAKTGSRSIQFTFTGSDSVGISGFGCSLDGAVFSACSSPVSYLNLNGGAHTFSVRAVDQAGNVDPTPATFSWFVSGNRFK